MATQSPSNSQSMQLLIAYHQNPSIKRRNQLVLLNAGLVRKIAHRVSHQCGELYHDLEQIGYFGLIRAIERFDPHQGCAFSSFAVPYIRGEMLHFLRDKGTLVKIPRRWQELYKEGQKVRQELEASLGRTPKDGEIAQVLKVSVSEWQETLAAARNRLPLSLDATVGPAVDYPVTLAETLPDMRDRERRYFEEDRQQLEGAMELLEQKTRAAIELVYMNELPRKEVAQRIGVSPMTVTRHLHRGVEQLVRLLEPQNAEPLAS